MALQRSFQKDQSKTQESKVDYKPLPERVPDTQYQDRLRYILEHGIWAGDTPQGEDALTCLHVPDMVFDLSNGLPVITERKMGFWRGPIAEIIAFMNGARTIDEIKGFGCNFWDDYRGMGTELGLEPDDMGPGSYGAAFHDFPMPDGKTLNQFAQVLEQIKDFPSMRTHLVTSWIPFYTARGKNRKVIVAPCHGVIIQFRILGGRLNMVMVQRSADMPIGVPSNMIQYATLLLMVCQVTGYQPGHYIHKLIDAHIYADQLENIEELIKRKPRPFPVLHIDPNVDNLFVFRKEHFALDEYDPHPAMVIPYNA